MENHVLVMNLMWKLLRNDMKSYVLGFLFTSDGLVNLIKKTKPEWQKGKINGIGGKIEDGETPLQAMRREFNEEAGVDVDSWKHFCDLTDERGYMVYCFYAFSDKEVKSMTDEEVILVPRDYLPKEVIPNLTWLVPMALSFQRGEAASKFYVNECYEIGK